MQGEVWMQEFTLDVERVEVASGVRSACLRDSELRNPVDSVLARMAEIHNLSLHFRGSVHSVIRKS